MAKLEIEMTAFLSTEGRRQTAWGTYKTFTGEKHWCANISPDIDDLEVIEDAKKIIDACYPQTNRTFFGGHHYSFCTREYLLNLILFYYVDHGKFPVGHVCIVDQWLWDVSAYRLAERLVKSKIWRWIHRHESFSPGDWIKIPALADIQ